MLKTTYTVKAPGKLMIAGEYAVLELNQKSIVVAVNRYVTVYIEYCEDNLISIPQWQIDDISWEIKNDNIEFNIGESRLDFIKNSLYIATKFLEERGIDLKTFRLSIESELNDPLTDKKYGLGSSAAIVVSIIKAIIKYHCEHRELVTIDQIFKLSVLSHFITQKNGSGADIAAAVFGGWIEYTAFSSKWLLNEIENNKVSLTIEKEWPNLSIRSLSPPSSLNLAIGWTMEVAKTGPMVKAFNKFRYENYKLYNEFIKESEASVERLINSLYRNDPNEFIISISQNRKALRKLGEYAGINIETDKMKLLCDVAEKFGCGKPSGAGGGDCGIAFVKNNLYKQQLYKEWRENGITPLDIDVITKVRY